ncbi:MAG: YigZ family protein [Lentimicrobiaceae bacterium]|nr:YigZ family protein [Lentimicrobiaceae bacterium]
MEVIDEYLTINKPSESLYKVKGSKFLGYGYQVNDEDEIKEILSGIKKEHYKATHHCYAYKLGLTEDNYRANDDGEPSGTAGLPIYGQIRSYNLTNVLIVSVRYFGGTKLGVSGLISAYKKSAKLTIEEAEIITKIINSSYLLEFDYIMMNDVMKIVKEFNININNNFSGTNCALEIDFRKSMEDEIIEKFENIRGLIIRKL